MKKKNNYTLLIIICIILIAIVGIMFFDDESEELVIQKEPEYVLLDDYSRFFTVNSCVYKYITYITTNKTQDLLNVLDSEYIERNKIDENNIFEFVNKLEGNYTFKSKKIYYQEIDKNYIKYYVYGDLVKEEIDTLGTKSDYYLIVNLDLENQLFSVTPYDGKLFKEEK